jgi:hypothetical protein
LFLTPDLKVVIAFSIALLVNFLEPTGVRTMGKSDAVIAKEETSIKRSPPVKTPALWMKVRLFMVLFY